MTQSTEPRSTSHRPSRRHTTGGTPEVLDVEAFEPEQVRPWRFHNRRESGMDDGSLRPRRLHLPGRTAAAGLARRLKPGDTHLVEATSACPNR